MTQRRRNLQTTLGSNMAAADAVAIEQFAGLNMNSYASASQAVSNSTVFVSHSSIWTEVPSGPSLINIYLPVTMTALGGLKITLIADQGLVVSQINYSTLFLLDAVAPGVKQISALAVTSDGGAVNAWTAVMIQGSLNATNAGVLQLQFAQSASNAGATTILAGATIDTIQISA